MKQFNNTEKTVKQKHNKPFIESIEIVKQYDQFPDISYLQQDYNDVTNKEEREKYIQQDKERLDAYNNDEWHYIGIIARTDIYIPLNLLGYQGGNMENNFRVIPITSSGLYGIESDYLKDYYDETKNGQIEELKDILKLLNVETDNINITDKEEIEY